MGAGGRRGQDGLCCSHRAGLQPLCTLATACARGHPRKTLPGLLSHGPGPRRARPPPSQPPLPPRSWRALHSPGPFRSLHVGDIIAGCHGKARLSKTRPLGLIPCVSGNEGFIVHLCNGAETARAGTAAWGQGAQPTLIAGCLACDSPVASPMGKWGPISWGCKADLCLLSYFWAAELSALV